jgi:hypothetical protein
LNTDDVLDLLAGGARPRKAKHQHRQEYQSQSHLPRRVLNAPVVEAMQPVPEGVEAEWDTHGNFDGEPQWTCSKCTFLNAGALKTCEMCEHHSKAPITTNVAQMPCDLQNDCDSTWPCLAVAETTSWTDCDVSSVASSWLDVNTFEEIDDDGSSSVASFILVDANHQIASTSAGDVQEISWAARASTSASASGAVINAPQMRVPPLVQRQRQKLKVKSEDDDNDEEDGFDFSDVMTAFPRFRRGKTQRLNQRRLRS